MEDVERHLFIGFTEFYGFGAVQWVLAELHLRTSAPTTEQMMDELDGYLQRERARNARDPLELEIEDALVECIFCAFDHGQFRNLDEYFRGRETWDSPTVRNRVWRELLLGR